MTISHMEQHDAAGHPWKGDIIGIRKTGPDTWSGYWQDEKHDLVITITDRAAMKIEIWEVQPEQHWKGTYTQDGDVYEAKGTLPPDRTFSAVLELPAHAA